MLKEKKLKRKNPRSPWTGKPYHVSQLHAVELIEAIRNKERSFGIKSVPMQGWTRRKMEGYLEQLYQKNPPQGKVEIYDKVTSIEAQKGNKSLWPREHFRHDFRKNKSAAKVYGMPDGSILIKSTKGKKLWKNFDYR